MSYSGQTVEIKFGGSFTNNQNIVAIPPGEMVESSRNVLPIEGVWTTRGGTEKVNGDVISGSPRIMSNFQFILDNGTYFVMKATADGNIYRDYTNTIKTGLTSDKYTSFVAMRDSSFVMQLYFTNGADNVQVWDGVAAGSSNIANENSDWSTDHPFQLISHGRKESRRLWGITGKGLYGSALGDPGEFVTGAVYFAVDDTLVGAVEIQDVLFVFSKNRFYYLDDSSSDSSLWGVKKASWNAGCSHWRNFVQTPTETYCMTDTGFIYPVTATDAYGDFQAGDITGAPYFMGDYIRKRCDLSKTDRFHGVWDEELRRILWFVVLNGKTQVTTAFPFYVDTGFWGAPCENMTYSSGFDASCATPVRISPATHHSIYIFTGSHDGFEWELEEDNANDDGNPYFSGVSTPMWFFGNVRELKHFAHALPLTEVEGDFELNINTWITTDDGVEVQLPTQTISLARVEEVFDTALFDTARWAKDSLKISYYDIRDYGVSMRKQFFVSGLNQKFTLPGIMIDLKTLGAQPQ